MPFTTPLLAGARIRESERTVTELVVPNPSGSRGVYVLNWSGVRALCSPTVYDTMLFRRCSRLIAIDPPSIRKAALDVALEGHAGRKAAAAAAAAVEHDDAERVQAQFELLTGLMEQVDHGIKAPSLADRTAAFDHRASAVLHRIASSLGQPAARLAAGLAVAGTGFASLGIASDNRGARIPRLLARLQHAAAELSHWLEDDPSRDIGGLGLAVMTTMSGVCDSGETLLLKTRLALTDPLALLKLWVRHGSGIVAPANRCDWLLDGWEPVALLWLSANSEASRRAALLEMASLMPVLPREAMAWADIHVSANATEQAFRLTSRENAWRIGGAAFSLIGRNEKLLAMRI